MGFFKWVLYFIPINVELLSQELPVLPSGISSVKGGADPLTNGQRDFKGPWPRLWADGTVWLSEKGNHSLFILAERKGQRCKNELETAAEKNQYEDKDGEYY